MIQRILPIDRDWPMFDVAHTREIEQHESAELPAHTLMQRAGASVARLAQAIAPHAQRVRIFAGPGNNGGDGFEAALHLLRAGKAVEVSIVGDPANRPADAQAAFDRASAAGVNLSGAFASGMVALQPPDLAIDALLGAGANRAPQGPIAAAIRAINGLECPVLAVDLPSGLDGDTGQPIGDDCISATHTLALLTLKPGSFTGAGRDHCGVVWLDTLGFDASLSDPQAWLSGAAARAPEAPRRHAQHKGSFGDVAVIGGAPGMVGAALLAARAAHAAGAGRVYLERLDAAPGGTAVDPIRPELMWRDDWSRSSPETLARATVVCGCGGGTAVRSRLPRLLSMAGRLVLDADALNAIAADDALAALLRARGARDRATVLTPHPLEAARLLACTTRDVQRGRLQAAQELALRYGCVVVLKGSGSVVAAPGEIACINATGNAALASAGTGDVLAGWLGGRWAQCVGGDAVAVAFAVARQAVAEHGAAAEPQPSGPLRAGDLIERLHRRS